MLDNFKPSLAAVLRSEGGYVNDPHDDGGATNCGITQKTYTNWLSKWGAPNRDVKNITSGEVATIYLEEYWAPEGCNDLPYGLDYAVFDFAVNSSVFKAETAIHAILKVNPSASVETLINIYMDERLAFLKGRLKWKYYGNGWTNRIASVRMRALTMAKQNATVLVKDKPKLGVPKVNGSKTYILSAILAAIAGTLTSVGSLDPKAGLGAILVSAILFALRHGMSTSVAYIIQTLSGIVQQALASSAPTEAAIAGAVKAAVAEALAEQSASQTVVVPK